MRMRHERFAHEITPIFRLIQAIAAADAQAFSATRILEVRKQKKVSIHDSEHARWVTKNLKDTKYSYSR